VLLFNSHTRVLSLPEILYGKEAAFEPLNQPLSLALVKGGPDIQTHWWMHLARFIESSFNFRAPSQQPFQGRFLAAFLSTTVCKRISERLARNGQARTAFFRDSVRLSMLEICLSSCAGSVCIEPQVRKGRDVMDKSQRPCVCRVFLFRLRPRDAARPRSTLRGLFAAKFASRFRYFVRRFCRGLRICPGICPPLCP